MPTNAIDLHIGRRIRRRRRLIGLTQVELGELVATKFQQIQKYEVGSNRVVASKLYLIAVALKVPVTYFYDGLADPVPANDTAPEDQVPEQEITELVQAYHQLGPKARRKLLELVKAMHSSMDAA